MVETTTPVVGPKEKPATRATMPEGSYLSQDTPGRMGNSMKSVAMADSAQKSAVMEIRFVDQPCA